MKVNEIFGEDIIQGEGPFMGCPATFVRLFGCVAPFCEFCDTPYSWNDESKESHEMSVEEIYEEIQKYNNRLIVITGGEPFAQEKIYELIDILYNNDYQVQIETSGKCEIKKNTSHITIVMSPKQYNGKFVVCEKSLPKADCYKFVVETQNEMNNIIDFHFDERLDTNKIYIMPKGATREEQLKNSPYVIEQCSKYGFKYGARLHVLLNDDKRGV